MARVDLRCGSCGFHLSVSDAQLAKPEGVRCPSCLAPVGVTGPVEGGPGRKQERILAARPDTSALKLKIGIGVGAGVLVLGVVVAVVLMKGSTPPPTANATPLTPAPGPLVRPKPAAASKTETASKTKAAPKTETTSRTEAAPKPEEAPRTEPATAPVSAAQPSQAGVPPLPDDLKSLREEMATLKEWHQNLAMTAPEKARLNALLAAGKGSPEDVEFLRGILNGPRVRAVKEEAMLIREARARLETDALEGLPVDKVTMKSGLVLHGTILEETDVVVKLARKIAGGAGEQTLQKADVKEVQKGKGNGAEFKTRWEAAKKGGPGALVGLLVWCKENALTLQASLTAFTILVDEPGRGEARQQAGLDTDPVARMLKAEQEGGFIPYEGRRWVPSELKAKLQKDGYLLMDGHWMKKSQQPKIVSVPNLFSYENASIKPVQISGTLAQDEVITYNVAQFQEKATVTPKRRFYAAGLMTVTATKKKYEGKGDAEEIILQDTGSPEAGKEMQGEVSITVPLNAPILEASVMTSAEVKPGGKIAVSLIIDGRSTPLYTCAAKESETHKLPDSIRGKTEVRLVADIRGQASYAKKTETKRVKGSKKDTNRVFEKGLDMTFNQLVPEYSAQLFPSTPNITFEVFRLTVTLGEPAPLIDKLFENREMPK